MLSSETPDDIWLTPHQAYALIPDAIFAPKSLARAADAGRVVIRRTPGGQRRYSQRSLEAFIEERIVAVREERVS